MSQEDLVYRRQSVLSWQSDAAADGTVTNDELENLAWRIDELAKVAPGEVTPEDRLKLVAAANAEARANVTAFAELAARGALGGISVQTPGNIASFVRRRGFYEAQDLLSRFGHGDNLAPALIDVTRTDATKAERIFNSLPQQLRDNQQQRIGSALLAQMAAPVFQALPPAGLKFITPAIAAAPFPAARVVTALRSNVQSGYILAQDLLYKLDDAAAAAFVVDLTQRLSKAELAALPSNLRTAMSEVLAGSPREGFFDEMREQIFAPYKVTLRKQLTDAERGAWMSLVWGQELDWAQGPISATMLGEKLAQLTQRNPALASDVIASIQKPFAATNAETGKALINTAAPEDLARLGPKAFAFGGVDLHSRNMFLWVQDWLEDQGLGAIATGAARNMTAADIAKLALTIRAQNPSIAYTFIQEVLQASGDASAQAIAIIAAATPAQLASFDAATQDLLIQQLTRYTGSSKAEVHALARLFWPELETPAKLSERELGHVIGNWVRRDRQKGVAAAKTITQRLPYFAECAEGVVETLSRSELVASPELPPRFVAHGLVARYQSVLDTLDEDGLGGALAALLKIAPAKARPIVIETLMRVGDYDDRAEICLALVEALNPSALQAAVDVPFAAQLVTYLGGKQGQAYQHAIQRVANASASH